VRSIPSAVDGLKPGQRKILFACFKRGKSMLKNEIKVKTAPHKVLLVAEQPHSHSTRPQPRSHRT
tara:strand:- start:301 stop:495 length:195 start_codon:yes stop_codon:yes gene_type:complete